MSKNLKVMQKIMLLACQEVDIEQEHGDKTYLADGQGISLYDRGVVVKEGLDPFGMFEVMHHL